MTSARTLPALRVLLISLLAVAAIYYGFTSIHWPLMSDSPIMHYVTFLMKHGMKPYSDISDNNMPGSYITEALAMKVFGPGDIAWRIYEFFLLATLALAMTVITKPYDWLGGFMAACLFLLAHAADGPNYAAEREELLTVLLMLAFACLFTSVRRRLPWLMLPFGLFAALAASIKPTMCPLVFLLLVLAGITLRRRGISPWSYLGVGSLGVLMIASLEVIFLLHYGALRAFLFVLGTVTPAYLSLNHPTWYDMLRGAFPTTMLLLLPFGVLCGVLAREWNWERWALALGAAFGLASYLAQRKGFVHHRYMFTATLLLLVCMALMSGLKARGWPLAFSLGGLLLVMVVVVPRYVALYRQQPTRSVFTEQLEADLRAMGDQKLQGRVQCFDLVYGCLNALYHLQLVENSGFTGDLLFFTPADSKARKYYQTMFWNLAARNPADVIVMSNEWFGYPNSFEKVSTWPEFNAYLNANYTQIQERRFPGEVGISRVSLRSSEPDAYRIYVRNNSPLHPTPAK